MKRFNLSKETGISSKYIGQIVKFSFEYYVVIGYDYFCEKYLFI